MDYKERIIQFGEGGFLRSFVDVFIHKMNEQGLYDGKVVVVQPIAKGLIPTIKVGTNRDISKRKKNWIDFDAGPMIDGADLKREFIAYCMKVAEGMPSKNEDNGYREIAIFKDGVTL